MSKLSLLLIMVILGAMILGCVTINLADPPEAATPILAPSQVVPPTQASQPPAPTLTPIILPPTATTSAGASQVNIYLIAIGDNGVSGKKIGCDDSVVPVVVAIQPTVGVLRAALTELFKLEGQTTYGQFGLYNALAPSHLAIHSLEIVNREAIIQLTGELQIGGLCDDPRIQAQLEETALQFSTIDRVSVFVNGVALQTLLSGQG